MCNGTLQCIVHVHVLWFLSIAESNGQLKSILCVPHFILVIVAVASLLIAVTIAAEVRPLTVL